MSPRDPCQNGLGATRSNWLMSIALPSGAMEGMGGVDNPYDAVSS